MKILMIMNGHNLGGAELQFIELANYLVTRHEVRLICMHGDKVIADGKLSPEIKVDAFTYRSGRKSLPKLVAAMIKGRSIAADAIITTSFVGDLIGTLSRFGRKCRLVSMQTVSECMSYEVLDRPVLKSFDVLVAGCLDIKDYLIGHRQDPDKISIVNNWVDFSARRITEDSAATRERFGIGADETVIGCIGRMHFQKGQEFLIRAFKTISAEVPNLRLVLVGDWPRMAEMKAEADNHPRILLTGTITGSDYTNLLAAFDVYVQPSRFEGLPRTLLDAMFMGLPVVATAVNGHKDAIRHGENGLMCPSENAEALAHCLRQILGDPDMAQKMAATARADALAHFSMTTQVKRIEDLLSGGSDPAISDR